MSLLDEHKEPFVLMQKSHVKGRDGDPVVTWTESDVPFMAALRFDSSIQAKRAQAEGVQDLYTIVTDRNILLEFNDVVKRLEDGTTYRVTTNGKDNKTPKSAGINMRVVSVKAWVIPDAE